jgi:hypothetical protein
MENNLKFQLKALRIFNDDLIRIRNTIIDQVKDAYIRRYDIQPYTLLKGKTYVEIGAEYMLRVEGVFIYKIKVLKNKYTQFSHKTKYLLTSEYPFNYKINVIKLCLKDTCNNTTAFIFIYEANNCEILATQQNIFYKKIEETYFNRVEQSLQNNLDDLYYVESAIIKTNMEKIWEIISNWNNLRKICPNIPEIVKFYTDDNIFNEGTIFSIKPGESKEYYLKINKYNDKLKTEKEIMFRWYDSNSLDNNFMDKSFYLLKISNSCIFLRIKYNFNVYLNTNQLSYISKEKRKIMCTLKQVLEI